MHVSHKSPGAAEAAGLGATVLRRTRVVRARRGERRCKKGAKGVGLGDRLRGFLGFGQMRRSHVTDKGASVTEGGSRKGEP